jgi:heme exporter protein A
VSEPAIRARGLEKRFGPAFALRDLDLDVAAGSSLAVLGPNGAGKTTLLRLIAGLMRPTGGSLHVSGHGAGDRQARARVGLVGHATGLYAGLTARENLIFAARLHRVKDAHARVRRLLDESGLASVADRPVQAFSHGMARRLSIVRALVHDPDVLLLDEPFTGLDRRASDNLATRLTALREAGHTLVLVTHDVGRAADVGTCALVLGHGHVARHFERLPADRTELERAAVAAGDAAT